MVGEMSKGGVDVAYRNVADQNVRRDAAVGDRRVAADLDAIAARALDPATAQRLRQVRREALARLTSRQFVLSGHWINWAPAGLALALVLVTAWTVLVETGQSLDADLLADALPFDAYLDAGFGAAPDVDEVRLLEN